MKTNTRILSITVLAALLTLTTACKKEDVAADIASNAGAISAGTIAKSWVTNCTVGSEAITGADRYTITLDLNANGSFGYHQQWYSGSCNPGNARVIFTVYGTFAVGSYVNGSSNTVGLTFTATSSEIMPLITTTVQTAFNTDCGMTSPFDASQNGVSSSHYGGHFATFGTMTCMNMDFPNSGQNVIENIATYSSGSLTLGAGEHGIPGVFSGNTVPTTTSVAFY